MGCGCRARTSSGDPVVAYELTLPDGSVTKFLTAPEAKAARRRAGGGTIRPLTS